MTQDFNPNAKTDEQNPVPPSPPGEQDQTPPEPAQEAPTNKKNKAELEAQVSKLEAEVQAMRRMLPSHITARPGHKVVFIKSDGVPTIKRDGKKHVEGSVNGVKFSVPCDIQTEVTDAVAEALAGVIKAQA